MTSFRGHVLVTGGKKKRGENAGWEDIYIYKRGSTDLIKEKFGIKLSLK